MCGRGVICDSANLYSSYLQLHTPILGELGLDLGPAILREVRRVDEVQQQQHVGIAQVVDGSVTAVACIIEGGEGGGNCPYSCSCITIITAVASGTTCMLASLHYRRGNCRGVSDNRPGQAPHKCVPLRTGKRRILPAIHTVPANGSYSRPSMSSPALRGRCSCWREASAASWGSFTGGRGALY